MSRDLKHFYEFGPFRVDASNRLLLKDGQVVPLTPRTFDLLLTLVERAGDVVEKEELLQRIWGDTIVEEANLSHQVHFLRKALGDDKNGNRYVETLSKRGYRFVSSVMRLEEHAPVPMPGSQALKRDSERADSGPAESGSDGAPPPVTPDRAVASNYLVAPGLPRELRIDSEMAAATDDLLEVAPQREQEAKDVRRVRSDPEAKDLESNALSPSSRRSLSRRWLWLVTFVATIVLVSGVWLAVFRRTPMQSGRLRSTIVPLTTMPGLESQPTFSPHGNHVAFCWVGGKGDNLDIYVKMIGTESLLRLTTHPAQDSSPAWSPDGRFVAFHRNTGNDSGVYLVPAIGGVERKLASLFPMRAHFRGRSLDWFPDGKSLAIVERVSEENPFQVSILSMETGDKRVLYMPSKTSVGVMALAVSRTGESVAFTEIERDNMSQNDLYTISKNDGAPERLTFDRGWIVGLDWDSAGDEILFASIRGTQPRLDNPFDLWRIPASGRTSVPISVPFFFSFYPHNPQISLTGDTLVVEQREMWTTDIWRAPGPKPSTNNEPPAKFIASTAKDENARYSPNGKKIAYVTGRSGDLEVWLCDPNGHNSVQLTSMGPKWAQNPRWAPDSSRLAFASLDGDIYTVSVNGGKATRAIKSASKEAVPSWSRDGRWIYFGSDRTGVWQIWKISAEGGEAIQVSQRGGIEAIESWDGRFVYFTRTIGPIWSFAKSSIWKMPVSGGEETRVVEGTSVGYWDVLEDGICYLNPEDDLPFRIEFLSFATGQRTTVALIDKEPIWNECSFSVSPDGRWILYTRRPAEERDLMLIENFRFQ